METFVTAADRVHHMEADLLNPERIIFSHYNALDITDGVTTATIVGSVSEGGYVEGEGTEARFYWLKGFTQLNSTSVLAADDLNQCLRIIDRLFNSTQQFVGECGTAGFRDGEAALFNRPWPVTKNLRSVNKVLVIDFNNNAIRQVDLISRMTTTFISRTAGLNRIRCLAFDYDMENLIICNNVKISRYNLTSETMKSIGGVYGYKDGKLENAEFDFPFDLISLSSSVTLAADYFNERLRVINWDEDEVKSICTGSGGKVDGPVSACKLSYPRSLLVKDGFIYIGEQYGIRAIPCEFF